MVNISGSVILDFALCILPNSYLPTIGVEVFNCSEILGAAQGEWKGNFVNCYQGIILKRGTCLVTHNFKEI